ncbi:hypothetical protein Pcaca05_10440 [Pectobacterium carotovorum subsp. carotovorum]|nr:hypothetical protein Pcaca05_10440 [Pectobacterium carotovorum subsp. carotovorum]
MWRGLMATVANLFDQAGPARIDSAEMGFGLLREIQRRMGWHKRLP